MAVPPGSAQVVTGIFCPRSQSTSNRHWVDFPVPSRPSSERNTGLGIVKIRIHHKGTEIAQRATKKTEIELFVTWWPFVGSSCLVVNCLLFLDPPQHLAGGER